jgi:hypothetical protein
VLWKQHAGMQLRNYDERTEALSEDTVQKKIKLTVDAHNYAVMS